MSEKRWECIAEGNVDEVIEILVDFLKSLASEEDLAVYCSLSLYTSTVHVRDKEQNCHQRSLRVI